MARRPHVRSGLARASRLVAATAVAVSLGGLAGGLSLPASTNPFLASPAASPSVAPAAEMVWKCDPAHCMALFRIHHVGAGQFWGMFDGVTGGFTWDEGSDAAPTFDVTSTSRACTPAPRSSTAPS